MNQKLKKLVVRLMFLFIINSLITNILLSYFISIVYLLIVAIYEDGNYTFDMV